MPYITVRTVVVNPSNSYCIARFIIDQDYCTSGWVGHRDSQNHGWVSGSAKIPGFGRVGRWVVAASGIVSVPTRQKNATQIAVCTHTTQVARTQFTYVHVTRLPPPGLPAVTRTGAMSY